MCRVPRREAQPSDGSAPSTRLRVQLARQLQQCQAATAETAAAREEEAAELRRAQAEAQAAVQRTQETAAQERALANEKLGQPSKILTAES